MPSPPPASGSHAPHAYSPGLTHLPPDALHRCTAGAAQPARDAGRPPAGVLHPLRSAAHAQHLACMLAPTGEPPPTGSMRMACLQSPFTMPGAQLCQPSERHRYNHCRRSRIRTPGSSAPTQPWTSRPRRTPTRASSATCATVPCLPTSSPGRAARRSPWVSGLHRPCLPHNAWQRAAAQSQFLIRSFPHPSVVC